MNTKSNSPRKDGAKRRAKPISSNNSDLEALYKYIEETKGKFELLDKKVSASLLGEIDEIKTNLDAKKTTELTIVEYSAYVAEINAIKERAAKPKLNWLSRILPQDPIVAGALLTLIGSVLVAMINGLQKASTPNIPATSSPTTIVASPVPGDIGNVTVSFSNTNTNSAKVHLVILQNDIEIRSFDIEPGSYRTLSLPPGSYQVEARATYPPLTPSANCIIQWQQNQSYAGNLTVNAGSQVNFQIRQFYFEPQEVCFTETPIQPSP